MKSKFALLMLALPTYLLVGCGSSGNGGAANGLRSLVTDSNISVKKKAVTQASDIVSFKDRDYHYFVFDLGVYSNVPVGNYFKFVFDGHGGMQKDFEVSETTATAVETSITKVVTHSTNWQNEFGASLTVQKEIGVDAGLIKAKASAEFGLKFTTSWGESDTYSTTNSYTRVEEYSKTSATKTSVSLSNDDPAGTYYYTMLVDFKAYGTIVKKLPKSSSEEPQYYAFVTPTVIGEGVAFSYNVIPSEFGTSGKIDFDLSVVEKYGLDTMVPQTDITKAYEESVSYTMITDVAGLDQMRRDLSENSKYRLARDIDMKGMQWSPFNSFNGIFDGAGFTLSNFTIDNEEEYAGFFKSVGSSGVVKNLTIENAKLKGARKNSQYRFAGMIAGSLLGGRIENCVVKNCEIDTSNSTKDGAENTVSYCIAGMLVGKIDLWGSITKSLSEGNKCYGFAKYHDAGWCEDADGEICRVYVGGIVGELFQGSLSYCSVPNVVSLRGKGEYRSWVIGDTNGRINVGVGGLAGRARKGNYSVSDCQGLSSEENISSEANPYNDALWFGDKWEKVTTKKSVEIALITD